MKRYDIYVHANGREKQVSTTFSLEGAKQMMQQYCDDHPEANLGALTVVGPDGEYDMYDLFDIRDVGGKKILVSTTDIYATSDSWMIKHRDHGVDLLVKSGMDENDAFDFMCVVMDIAREAIEEHEDELDDPYSMQVDSMS